MRLELSQDIARLAACERLLVACDFDGTLAEFVDDPRLAEPAPGIMSPLLGLTACAETTCTVVSARETDDLAERMAHPQGLILAGGYGRELVTGSGISPAGYKQLHEATTMLEEIAARYAGAWVERKRHAVVLHVRKMREPMAGIALSVARASLAPLYGLRAIGGVQAVEWCAYAPDKSLAVDALRRRTKASAVLFVGDGEADEAVFITAQAGDVMIKVGEGETRATHRLQGPSQVAWMLQALYEARSELMQSPHRTRDTSSEMSQQPTV
jgi:trehalose 6-phosphate phosphatase